MSIDHVQIKIKTYLSNLLPPPTTLTHTHTHSQFISEKVRELLGVEQPYWNRSITLRYAPELNIFLEQKSFTGRKSDQLEYQPSQQT